MERAPQNTPDNNEANVIEQDKKRRIGILARSALEYIKRTYDLDLDTHEVLRLWAFGRQVVDENDAKIAANPDLLKLKESVGPDDDAYHDAIWKADLFGSKEIVHRFLMSEFGATPDQFPQGNLVLTVPDDFKKYLKILQQRNRDGVGDQTTLIPKKK